MNPSWHQQDAIFFDFKKNGNYEKMCEKFYEFKYKYPENKR